MKFGNVDRNEKPVTRRDTTALVPELLSSMFSVISECVGAHQCFFFFIQSWDKSCEAVDFPSISKNFCEKHDIFSRDIVRVSSSHQFLKKSTHNWFTAVLSATRRHVLEFEPPDLHPVSSICKKVHFHSAYCTTLLARYCLDLFSFNCPKGKR